MYVYSKLGVALQRSANDQFLTTLHVPYSQAQPGDLIFFYDTTGYVYHVGMYAGNGMMWDAPHSGAVVRYENVWYPNSGVGRRTRAPSSPASRGASRGSRASRRCPRPARPARG